MKPLELDYVAPPRRSPWPGIAVLALALVIGAQMAVRHQSVSRELDKLASVQGSATRAMPRAAAERIDDEVRQVEFVVRQLTLPWARIVKAIESSSMPEVGVLDMQPDTQQQVLKLTAEARTREAMLEYVRRLGQSGTFSEIHLVNHQVQKDDPAQAIQFAVHASLKEAR